MTLDIVEGHFSRSHAKVIGAEEKHWQFQCLVHWLNYLTSMKNHVIHHQHCVSAPVLILLIQVSNQFHHEVRE